MRLIMQVIDIQLSNTFQLFRIGQGFINQLLCIEMRIIIHKSVNLFLAPNIQVLQLSYLLFQNTLSKLLLNSVLEEFPLIISYFQDGMLWIMGSVQIYKLLLSTLGTKISLALQTPVFQSQNFSVFSAGLVLATNFMYESTCAQPLFLIDFGQSFEQLFASFFLQFIFEFLKLLKHFISFFLNDIFVIFELVYFFLLRAYLFLLFLQSYSQLLHFLALHCFLCFAEVDLLVLSFLQVEYQVFCGLQKYFIILRSIYQDVFLQLVNVVKSIVLRLLKAQIICQLLGELHVSQILAIEHFIFAFLLTLIFDLYEITVALLFHHLIYSTQKSTV